MNLGTLILILGAIVLCIIIWHFLKPYTLKYDTILSLIGGNGSGKTCTGVKTVNTMIKKATIAWFFAYTKERRYNRKAKKYNEKIKEQNKNITQWNKLNPNDKIPYLKPRKLKYIPPKPQVYSTIPMYFKRFIWSKREYSCKFKLSHALCLEPIAQWSVILLDELPQFVNQYNWDLPEIQNEFCEFTTFFRHYYDGHIVITSQAAQEIVAQIRRKMNVATWCFNFRKAIWPLGKWFYKMSCCDLIINDSVSVTASTLIEENTRTFWGKFPRKGTYDSRCYSDRVNNMYYALSENPQRFSNLKTNEIIHFDREKVSMCDDTTTWAEKTELAKEFKLPYMTKELLYKIAYEEMQKQNERWTKKNETRPQEN